MDTYNNFILIGMPGSGKSTIGVLLAKALNYDFLDTDILIQKKTGKKLYETINEKGVDAFLQLENNVLKELDVKNTIIATGGSAVFGTEAMMHLSTLGKIIYLNLSSEEIIRRVNNIKTRGIVMKKGKTLKDIYAERVPLYEKYANYDFKCDELSMEECVSKLVEYANSCFDNEKGDEC